MSKRLLLIDGNYFAMRALGSLNYKDSKNTLETEIEQRQFTEALKNSLYNLWTAFAKHCNNMVFVVDSYSWRKNLEPHKPYYIEKDEPIGYKEPRAKIKEESDINYDNYYKLFDQFVNELKDVVTTIRVPSLEGDDILLLLADMLDFNNIEGVIFCSDGDLKQLVRDRIVLFRNIKSKNAPYGEFVVNQKFYDSYCSPKSAVNQLLNDTKEYKDLINMDLYDDNSNVKRVLNEGITIPLKFQTILNKIVCGDSSDNILPLFRRKSTTGTRNYKSTEKNIAAAMELQGLNYNDDEHCKTILNNPTTFIYNLSVICKYGELECDSVIQHFKHNMKLGLLNSLMLPTEAIEKFKSDYSSKITDSINCRLKLDDLKTGLNITFNKVDAATDLLKDSIF